MCASRTCWPGGRRSLVEPRQEGGGGGQGGPGGGRLLRLPLLGPLRLGLREGGPGGSAAQGRPRLQSF